MTTTELTGLVLAGGDSRRMGTDKALLDVEGDALVRRVADRLAMVCVDVLVAPGRRRLPDLPWRQVYDLTPGAGPLAGIIAGLDAASTPLLAVAAVDMPDADPGVFLSLAVAWSGEPAVVPVVDGRPQPLHAVYDVRARSAFAAAFAAGERSPTRALARLGALQVAMDAPAAWSRDLDTPQDLDRFRRSTD